MFPGLSLFSGWVVAGGERESVLASCEPMAASVGEAGHFCIWREPTTSSSCLLTPAFLSPCPQQGERGGRGLLSRAGQGLPMGQTKGGHLTSEMSRSIPPQIASPRGEGWGHGLKCGSLQGPQGKGLFTLNSNPYVKWQLPFQAKAKSGQWPSW